MIIKQSESDSSIHIDFVPMVDTLFNLLIFFLLATTIKQAEREMSVALPVSASAMPITTALREFIINIDSNGEIIVAGQKTGPESLRAMLTDLKTANPQQKVSIRGDRTAAYASIMLVLDICKSSGFQQPFLDTVPIKE